MQNRWKSDEWIDTLDLVSRVAVSILIIGSACSLVIITVMLAHRIILVP